MIIFIFSIKALIFIGLLIIKLINLCSIFEKKELLFEDFDLGI